METAAGEYASPTGTCPTVYPHDVLRELIVEALGMKYLMILILSIAVAVLSGCSSTGKGGAGNLSSTDTIETSGAPGGDKGVADVRGDYALGGAGSSKPGNALEFGNGGIGITTLHR